MVAMGLDLRDQSWLDAQKPFFLKDVTAIICAKNAELTIEECIRSANVSGVENIILIDGNSKDQTRAIAKKIGVDVYLDKGTGLGAARNLGARLCNTRLALFLGPDNIMLRETLIDMISAINSSRAVATSCMTIQRREDYWSRAANVYRKSVVRPGDATSLPTPTLYISALLSVEPYSETRKFSDDSELFERWNRTFGGRNIVVDRYVFEIGNETLRDHLRRYSYYGVSDYENFIAGKESGWTHARQFQSLLHPLKRHFLGVLREVGFCKFLLLSPASIIFTFVRYLSWAKVAVGKKLTLRKSNR